MGGAHAPDDIDLAHRTQVWLAAGDETAARATGEYLFHAKPAKVLTAARDASVQDHLLATCEKLSGVPFPGKPDFVASSGAGSSAASKLRALRGMDALPLASWGPFPSPEKKHTRVEF